MKRPTHILVIRLSAMGDVAMTVPVLRVFRQTYPDIKLTVVSRPAWRALFHAIPNLEFIEADVYGKHRGFGLLKLAKEAKNSGIDAVADLHDVIRSKILRTYFSVNGIPACTIDKGRNEKKALIDNPQQLHRLKSTHQRYADVFEGLGCPISLEEHNFPQQLELDEVTSGIVGKHSKKMLGIAPFAAYTSKAYPLDMMKEVLFNLNADEKYKVYLFGGGSQEEKVLQDWEGQFEHVTNVAGKLTLAQELALMSNLDLMVAMDSSNGHLAALFDIPVLTLWGVTHPYIGFTPFNQPNSHQLVSNSVAYPKIPTSVYGNKFPNDYKEAMRSISVETVLRKIDEII